MRQKEHVTSGKNRVNVTGIVQLKDDVCVDVNGDDDGNDDDDDDDDNNINNQRNTVTDVAIPSSHNLYSTITDKLQMCPDLKDGFQIIW
jgi:hypothetical protein